MLLDEITITGKTGKEFVADALEIIQLKFVRSPDQINNSSPGYAPEFAHQHFGENEKIVGYKNLRVNVFYSDTTLYTTYLINYDEKVSARSVLKPDDIEFKIRDALPATQLDAYLPVEKFKQKLLEQNKFRPFGTLVTKFSLENENHGKLQFELYKIDKEKSGLGDSGRLQEALQYLERAQSLAFWYIDGVNYTDEEDHRFFDYFLFELRASDENGHPCFAFAGYANLYRFFHYPNMERVRIAQLLLAPPYRNKGLGYRFLGAICSDLWTMDSVYDITAEDPADSFIYMRDYLDCLNCNKLPEYSRENLLNNFSAQMATAARQRFKVNEKQARRVYEILRLHSTRQNVAEEWEAYKVDVVGRLRKTIIDPSRDGRRLSRVLAGDANSLAIVMQAVDREEQRLDDLFHNTVTSYRVVLKRLAQFEKDFV